MTGKALPKGKKPPPKGKELPKDRELSPRCGRSGCI
jgi:hypothetical protein